MNVLVIGSGGREHALFWKLSQSRQVNKLYCIPGNAGITQIAECVNISYKENFDQVAKFVEKNKIELTVVGPEVPLVDGIVDYFQDRGLAIFGPNKAAAQLEGSKVWAKEFLTRHKIPTANYKIFNEQGRAIDYLATCKMPIVVKADGLAAGKGVLICKTVKEAKNATNLIMSERAFGAAGDRIVIEDCLFGKEVSMLAFCDGKTIVPMVTAQDYKRALDNDEGLNTGGMGSISPSPNVTPELAKKIYDRVLVPTVQGLNKDGIKYVGVLYAGLMLVDPVINLKTNDTSSQQIDKNIVGENQISNGVDGEPQVLEFNCRFGDPETQVILPRLKTDLVEIIQSCLAGKLDEQKIEWVDRSAVCVVLASGGYPGKYQTGYPIDGLDTLNPVRKDKFSNGINQNDELFVYHAGTLIQKVNINFSIPQWREGNRFTESEIEFFKKIEKETGTPIPWNSEEEMLKMILEKTDIPFVSSSDFVVDLELLKMIPKVMAENCQIFPVRQEDDGSVLIAFRDPMTTTRDLELFLNRPVKQAVMTSKDIKSTIAKHYGTMKEDSDISKKHYNTMQISKNSSQIFIKKKQIVTAGGRVLNVVSLGNSITEARTKVYEAINHIRFKDMHYRMDIGK